MDDDSLLVADHVEHTAVRLPPIAAACIALPCESQQRLLSVAAYRDRIARAIAETGGDKGSDDWLGYLILCAREHGATEAEEDVAAQVVPVFNPPPPDTVAAQTAVRA